jgi:predicted MFS family arabinose efflux permease
MVIGGGALSVGALALLPLSRDFWPLLAAHLAVALGQAFGIPPANAYAVQEGRTFGMGASMTMFMMAMQLGNGVGPVVLGSIADWLGLESAFYAAALCMAAGVVFFARKVGDSRQKR